MAAVACASEDPKVERRGGPLPDGGGSTSSAGAPSDGAPIAFCDAMTVVRAKCQRCHGDPPANGAPVSFLTYDDWQAPYFDTESKWWEVATDRVERDVMPFLVLNNPPFSLMPPVQPLTVDEKATLLGWLKQGAMPVGGTECP